MIVPAQCPCQTPTAVLDFDLVVTRRGGCIFLRWRAGGANFVAFDVFRSEGTDAESKPFERIGFGKPTPERGVWDYEDKTARSRETYMYRVEGRLADGTTVAFEPVIARTMPGRDFALSQVRPFPAAETTAIAFSIPRLEAVRLEVYDVSGRRVRVLLDEVRAAGEHLVTWDGRNDAGQDLANGFYFVRLGWHGGWCATRAVFVR
jgi:hypothetical protein